MGLTVSRKMAKKFSLQACKLTNFNRSSFNRSSLEKLTVKWFRFYRDVSFCVILG